MGTYDGKEFDNRELEFALGEGIDLNIPIGLEKALYKMNEKEKSRITLQPKYGFGSSGNAALGVPPNAVLQYVVELKGFTKVMYNISCRIEIRLPNLYWELASLLVVFTLFQAKEAWQLNGVEKLECSREFKAKGTKYFSEEKYRLAAAQYKKIVDFLKSEARKFRNLGFRPCRMRSMHAKLT